MLRWNTNANTIEENDKTVFLNYYFLLLFYIQLLDNLLFLDVQIIYFYRVYRHRILYQFVTIV